VSSKIVGHGDEATDWAVLASLLSEECVPWSIEEIAREIGDRSTAIESLKRLRRAGLVHRCDKLVFASRPARKFEELRA